MNTFKTAVVLTTLLGVGYGVHVVLNRPLSHDAGRLDFDGQVPASDEFGLPQLDIQPPGQGLAEKAQSAIQNVRDGIGAPSGMIGQAQNAVQGYASQAADAVAPIADQAQRFSDQASEAANYASSAANGFASDVPSKLNSGYVAAQQAVSDVSLNPADFPALPDLPPPASAGVTNQQASTQFAPTAMQMQPNASTAPHGLAARQQLAAGQNSSGGDNSAPSGHGMPPVASASYGDNPAVATTDQQLPYTTASQPQSAAAGLAPRSYNDLPSGVSRSRPAIAAATFANMWKTAMDKQANGMPADALFTLSLWYSNPELSAVQRDSLIPTLDDLAGQVIFSREHLFGPPHTVQPGETLAQIAARYAISPEFIARVNGLDNPAVLTPGQQLKVVTGPFRAELSRSRREITLFVGSYYAGRFSAGVGRDLPVGDMALEVAEKSGARPYIDPDSNQQTVAGDPSNPYGAYWIGLRTPGTAVDPRIGLHSTGNRVEASDTRGCISLSDRDADDMQAILSIGSRFTIHR